ncbi:type III secretion system domain-containing protein [Parashewanella tropica]|uniref:type III secretion system domain-containing protein n=1 Tax=Parashewanella tropica TaxID=2547970 RepID=UPI0010595A38|nr:type III secretion system domain-containing protein [Parashewanella tropica]
MSEDFFSSTSDTGLALRQCFELIWRPMANMHPSWWQKLGVQAWQGKYQPHSTLGHRIETMIVSRAGLIDEPMPTKLNEQDNLLIQRKDKLTELLLVLGLYSLNSPDYLSLKSYREVLQTVLAPEQIQQAWALWPQRPTSKLKPVINDIAEKDIVKTALQVAVIQFSKELTDSIVWRALLMTFPATDTEQLSKPLTAQLKALDKQSISMSRWLTRLERLL